MTNSKFSDFVKQQQHDNNKEEEEAVFDPKKQLEEWFHYIEVLYEKINSFMKTYIDDGMATISYNNITLTEDFSGSYQIRQMLLKIGRSTITFTPIATMLIGAKGRVDVQGPSGGARLILMNEKVTNASQLITVRVSRPGDAPPALPKKQDINWAWKIISSPPKMDFIDLTEDSLSDMILTVAKS